MKTALPLALLLSAAPGVVTPDGKDTWAVADAVGAVGVRVSPLQLPLLWNHGLFETQLGAFVGSPIGSPRGPTPVPILSGRLHLRNETGFAVYAGVSWAFVAESLVWTYGVGNRF
jgi:hypothetical protein